MQAIGRQPQRAPDGAPVHCERDRPEQAKLYRLVQQHAAAFIAETEVATLGAVAQALADESRLPALKGLVLRRVLVTALAATAPDQAAAHMATADTVLADLIQRLQPLPERASWLAQAFAARSTDGADALP